MFIQNKYTQWYNNIIDRAKHREITGYTEKHHIIPKSLGGSDDKENLVSLTAREHFICHYLLTKMTTGLDKRSMWHATWTMANLHNPITQQRYKISSRIYELIKQKNALALSEANTGKSSKRKGKTLTPEWKAKISKTLTGIKPSLERNAKVSAALTGRKRPPRSQEWIDKLQNSIDASRIICEHCNKRVIKAAYNRWHGNNCKASINK